MFELDFDLEQMVQWPLKTQLAVMLLFSVLLHGVGYWLYLQPKLDQLQSSKFAEMQLKSQLVVSAQQVERLSLLKAPLEQLRQRSQQLAAPLQVDEAKLASLPATISAIGKRYAVTVSRIHWGQKQSHGLFERWPIDIELSGHYHDIGDFSAALASLPLMIIVEQADWQRVATQRSKLHVSLRAYHYQIKAVAVDEE